MLAFCLLLGVLCILLALLVIPLGCTKLGFQRCASCWTRSLGGGRWGHYLRGPLGVLWFVHQRARKITESSSYNVGVMLYLLASVRSPSLHGFHDAWYFGLTGQSGEIAGKVCVRPFCFPSLCLSVKSDLVEKVLGSGFLAFVDR